MSGSEVPVHICEIDGREIAFECPTNITRKRAENLLSKEPGTISWINGFVSGSIFWDIGANIGAFTLYAAIKRQCRVYACEPGSANYYGLNNNILRNSLDDQVKALAVALDERTRFGSISMRDNMIGGSLHSFETDIDYKGDQFTPAWRQGALAVTLDDLHQVFRVPAPAYIKIDVDGLETSIVRGGRDLLSRPEFRSILVEVDLNDQSEVSDISRMLEDAGLCHDQGVDGNTARNVKTARIYNLIYTRLDGLSAKGANP